MATTECVYVDLEGSVEECLIQVRRELVKRIAEQEQTAQTELDNIGKEIVGQAALTARLRAIEVQAESVCEALHAMACRADARKWRIGSARAASIGAEADSALQQRRLTSRLASLERDRTLIHVDDARAVDGEARLLSGLQHLVLPGTLRIGVASPYVRFTTQDIHIRDTFGGYYPFNFGKFIVSVELNTSTLARVVSVEVKPLESPSREYPHPHVASLPCLGRAEAMILEAMLNRQYALVVSTVLDFLEQYNDVNPFQSLSAYGILYPGNSPSCELDDHLLADCTCTRCPLCFRSQTATSWRRVPPIQSCGCCSTCCITRHRSSAQEGEGINGSSCELKEST